MLSRGAHAERNNTKVLHAIADSRWDRLGLFRDIPSGFGSPLRRI